MTKKTTTICCALALLATTAATPAFSQAKNFAGPSIAIGAGYSSYNPEGSLIEANGAGDGLQSTSKLETGKNDFKYLADLSYGFVANDNLVVSLGATYDFNDSEATFVSSNDAVNTVSIKGKLKDHYSLYIQPTYLLNNSTGIFAKVSYNYAKNSITLAETNESVSFSENLEGWGYGVGAKTFLNNNLYLQFEGSLVKYDKQSKSIAGELDTYTISAEPEVLSALISIGYKF
jgi:opacity protein-like surface antigen